jgi:predicted Zn-ribbon and HTH transcriptional regulator
MKNFRKCNRCGHEWFSNLNFPKACPKCKRYDYISVSEKGKVSSQVGI